MNKYIAILLAVTCLLFTGCDKEQIADFAYDEVGGQYVVTDSFNNSLTFERDQAKRLAGLPEEDVKLFLDARFRSSFPQSYADPSVSVTVTDQQVTPIEVQLSPELQSLTAPLSLIPGFGDLSNLLVTGLAGIGAIYYRRKKNGEIQIREGRISQQDAVINRKETALEVLGTVVDIGYDLGKTLPDPEAQIKFERAMDDAILAVGKAKGVLDEVETVIKKTETPYKN